MTSTRGPTRVTGGGLDAETKSRPIAPIISQRLAAFAAPPMPSAGRPARLPARRRRPVLADDRRDRAALGLGVEAAAVTRVGPRVLVTVLLSVLLLVAVSLGLIALLGL